MRRNALPRGAEDGACAAGYAREMRKAIWVTLAVMAGLGALYGATLRQAGTECEACMAFEGRSVCRSVRGPHRSEAERQAVSNACALLTDGVTQRLGCERTAPVSIRCSP